MWHVIDTPIREEVHATYRPFPWKRWETINDKVAKLLHMDIIEPSSSAWRIPIVLVPKLDGSVCFCIDFRGVNKIAAFDVHPMPRPDDLLSQLGRTRYVSALDLTKGY